MPSEIYIALRLSGSDILKWCRNFLGHEAHDIMDIPLPIMSEWFSKSELLRQMDLLERGMYSGMIKFEQAQQELRDKRQEGGFVTPTDPEFAQYLKYYKARKAKYASQDDKPILMVSGEPWTYRDARLLELRNQCKAAILRRRGIHARGNGTGRTVRN